MITHIYSDEVRDYIRMEKSEQQPLWKWEVAGSSIAEAESNFLRAFV